MAVAASRAHPSLARPSVSCRRWQACPRVVGLGAYTHGAASTCSMSRPSAVPLRLLLSSVLPLALVDGKAACPCALEELEVQLPRGPPSQGPPRGIDALVRAVEFVPSTRHRVLNLKDVACHACQMSRALSIYDGSARYRYSSADFGTPTRVTGDRTEATPTAAARWRWPLALVRMAAWRHGAARCG
jgi:hypothetical protein